MFENDANTSPSHNDEYNNPASEYLKRAAQACAAGNDVLGMHLYLAAFEQSQRDEGPTPSEAALNGLREAWRLSCMLKERSIAEYVFERLEPYLSADETAQCAEQLQDLALDKLEEFGLSREDLEDMTDMISQDFMGMGMGASPLMRVEHVTSSPAHKVLEPVQSGTPNMMPSQNTSSEGGAPGQAAGASQVADAAASAGQSAKNREIVSSIETITYRDLVGYDEAVSLMRDFGVGMDKDEQYQQLVALLNERHGLERMPATDTLLFRSPAREDANHFMNATLGELNLPAIRMRMEENVQGLPVLCVMAQADKQPKLNAARNAFLGEGVLMLEDLDMWMSPFVEPASDDLGGLIMASLSRGAREAISLIRSAVENPDVYVVASASDTSEIDPFFYELLEPLSVVEIDYPTASERADIWMEIARDHPSLRGIDQAALVRYSVHMPRFDIYMAAREAIEKAYKSSLVARRYVPVTPDNVFDKLAAYQPLESAEYQALEDVVVDDFRRELEHLEDFLQDEEN